VVLSTMPPKSLKIIGAFFKESDHCTHLYNRFSRRSIIAEYDYYSKMAHFIGRNRFFVSDGATFLKSLKISPTPNERRLAFFLPIGWGSGMSPLFLKIPPTSFRRPRLLDFRFPSDRATFLKSLTIRAMRRTPRFPFFLPIVQPFGMSPLSLKILPPHRRPP